MSTFSFDIVYVIAEKLLLLEDNEQINENSLGTFMLISRTSKAALLAQLAKKKALRCSYINNKWEFRIYNNHKFYLSFSMNSEVPPMRQIPIAVTAPFLRFVLASGRFAPIGLHAQSAFSAPQWACKLSNPMAYPKSASEAFNVLLDLKADKSCLPFLALEYVEIHEYDYDLIDCYTIFALNARELDLNLTFREYNCLNAPTEVAAPASCTETLTIVFNCHWDIRTDNDESFQHFPVKQWTRLFIFILRSCPSLKKFMLTVTFIDIYESFVNLLAMRVYKAMDGLVNHVLPAVFKECKTPADLSMTVRVNSSLPDYEIQAFPLNEYPMLANFGVAEHSAEGEIVRTAFFDRNTLSVADKERTEREISVTTAERSDSQSWLEFRQGCWVGYAVFINSSSDVSDDLHMFDNSFEYDDPELYDEDAAAEAYYDEFDDGNDEDFF